MILNDVPVLLYVGILVPSTVTVAPVKFVPVMVTTVPPLVGPEVGEIEVIVGGGTT